MRGAVAALLLLIAAPAAAQDQPAAPAPPDAPDPAAVLDSCLSGDAEGQDCIGVIAAPCVEDADGQADAVTPCYAAEAATWTARLDSALATLRADAEASDAIAAEEAAAPTSEAAPAPAVDDTAAPQAQPAPLRVEALDRAQSTWLAWRDAECRWHSLGFDPQAATVAEAECRMKRTADRALTLEPRGMAVDGP